MIGNRFAKICLTAFRHKCEGQEVRAEDAVNDFGVPEKSKYSTATKPVLLK